jgi:DNA-binding XRE family transcriptional regulator
MREDTPNPAPIGTPVSLSSAVPQPELLPLSLLGEVLVASRKEQGMTQEALASRLGMLQEAVARMEREKYRAVSLERLVRVAEALNLNLTLITPVTDEPQ